MSKRPRDKYILSYGAGVNSTALMILLLRNRKPLDYVVFADTGSEVPETYRYLMIADRYLKEHNVPLTIVRSNNGSLIDTCTRRRVIPSEVWRWSTRDYKITPIYRFYRSFDCHIQQYVGIASDEIERMKDSRADYVSNLFPLVDAKCTRTDCENIIRQEGLPLPVKSGCFFCPFNNLERWQWLYDNHPDLYRKAMLLEENSKHFPKQHLANPSLRSLAKSFKRREKLTILAQAYPPCGGDCMT
ncbi:MAG: phosphoadenosine phosphosulfate reductase family protein [Candidatus Bathyarchaeia archaeon]